MKKLTEPQARALDWLPSDGAWRIHPGRLVAAISSLHGSYRELLEWEWGFFGSRGGRALRWRLTPAGVAFKAAREAVS